MHVGGAGGLGRRSVPNQHGLVLLVPVSGFQSQIMSSDCSETQMMLVHALHFEDGALHS